jgi:1,4-dihydroxy-2-naphthoyl-CoA synthase
MSDSEGSISVEQRGPILLIGLNRPAKYNGYTPTMAKQLVEAFTRPGREQRSFSSVCCLATEITLLRGSICPSGQSACSRKAEWKEGAETPVDPLALGRACRKPIITAGAGHYLYVWHRDCVGRRHRDRGG